jgi:hypothetical protein
MKRCLSNNIFKKSIKNMKLTKKEIKELKRYYILENK